MNKSENNLNIKDRIIPVDYWHAQRSGKIIELLVTPRIDQNPAQYRLGIIQIGRIIFRINSSQNLTTKPRIQLFPNLAENQLVATVFWPELLTSDLDIALKKSPGESYSKSLVQKLSKKYNLTLKKHHSESDLIPDKKISNCYYISSVSNQPFIWLKVGQFVEELKWTAEDAPNFTLDHVKILGGEKATSKDSCYLQALMYLSG